MDIGLLTPGEGFLLLIFLAPLTSSIQSGLQHCMESRAGQVVPVTRKVSISAEGGKPPPKRGLARQASRQMLARSSISGPADNSFKREKNASQTSSEAATTEMAV